MLIDSHCHLIFNKYEKTPDQIVKQAKNFGVEKIITIGTSLKENDETLDIVKVLPGVYCGLGIFPHEDVGIKINNLMITLESQLKSSDKVVALGEIGLDITDRNAGRSVEEQSGLFRAQLELAEKLGFPVIIHNRNGDNRLIDIIKPFSGKINGVFHCFRQDVEFAKQVLDLGFFISFTGIITYPSNRYLRDVVKMVPNDRFLVETDAPWLPPQQLRGKINYPEYVKIVAEEIAQVKGEPLKNIEEYSYRNTCSLFGLDM